MLSKLLDLSVFIKSIKIIYYQYITNYKPFKLIYLIFSI